MADIILPYKYRPRGYQRPFWQYMEKGGNRYVGAWHRRAGKDHTVYSWIQKAMWKRPGLYWHVLPDQEQGRRVIWNNMTGDGDRFIDLIPPQLVARKRDDHMLIETVNGSIYQVIGGVGSDGTAKHLRGPNPFGVVFSEFAFFQHPEAWDIVRPILNENGGWAVFISTPMGHNWFYDMVRRARDIPGWRVEILTVNETRRDDGLPVVTEAMIDEDRAAGFSEAMIQQEYYCSFDSPFEGAIWGDDMRRIRAENGVGHVPYDPRLPVETWWDLGIQDPGAVIFLQSVGNERRFIDYHQQSNWSLIEWIKFVREKPYVYSRHIAPWDIGHRNPDTGKLRIDFARDLGIRFDVAKKPMHVGDQILVARAYLRRYKCRFDAVKAEGLIAALSQYRWKKDKQGNPTDQIEKNDLYEHGGSAFRTGVTMDQDQDVLQRPRQTTALGDYDVLNGVNPRDILARERRQAVALDEEGEGYERSAWWGQGS